MWYLLEMSKAFLVLGSNDLADGLMSPEHLVPKVWHLADDLITLLVDWLPLQVILLLHLQHFVARLVVHLLTKDTPRPFSSLRMSYQ